MAKVYLKAYRSDDFEALNNSSFTYILTCLEISFFGFFKNTFTSRYTIPYDGNTDLYFANWDHLIKTQKPLK